MGTLVLKYPNLKDFSVNLGSLCNKNFLSKYSVVGTTISSYEYNLDFMIDFL